jgi:hypothetical protein
MPRWGFLPVTVCCAMTLTLIAPAPAAPKAAKKEAAAAKKEATAAKKDAAEDKKVAALMSTVLEVAALELIYDFKLDADQMRAMKAVAATTMSAPRKRDDPGVGDRYLNILRDLHTALIEAVDDPRITTLEGKMADLVDAKGFDIDDEIISTGPATAQAVRFVAMLSPRQLGSYFAANGDNIRDPADVILDGLTPEEGQTWAQSRAAAVAECVDVVAAGDAARKTDLAKKLTDWLEQTHALPPEQIASDRKRLRGDLVKLIGPVDSSAVLRRYAERDMAQLLSSPRLVAAIEARLANVKE